ncbi:MAG: phosphoribosyltransferase family protein [Deltaproteobacteria bacterium]|nr:phosphoribosyltransferase family protein [Deltaproteobacteria bacterium]
MGKLVEEPSLKNRVQVFTDRAHAGRLLAERLLNYRGQRVNLFAIPAGGVPVAAEIARRLAIPLELIIVRKIQLPSTTEAGFGALNPAGEAIFNDGLLARLNLAKEEIAAQTEKAAASMRRREERLRNGKPYPQLAGQDVIVVDDGLASGYTMRAAVQFLKRQGAGRIIAAVPTGSERTVQDLLPIVDELVCLNVRGGWSFAVADAYEDWYDLEEEEVLEILASLPPQTE